MEDSEQIECVRCSKLQRNESPAEQSLDRARRLTFVQKSLRKKDQEQKVELLGQLLSSQLL